MRTLRIAKAFFLGSVVIALGSSAEARTGVPIDGNPYPMAYLGDFETNYGSVYNNSNNQRDWYLPAKIDNTGSKTMTIYGTASSNGATVCYGAAATAAGSITTGSTASITSYPGVTSITTGAVTVASGGTFTGVCTMIGGGAVRSSLKTYSYTP